ncbi:MAG: hypothetical protein IPF58_16725 [Saprospirales bacterium]|nr:hypothetical protein [Saprospirales bacterium]
MTKHFTLLLLFIATFFSFSKDNFEISPIDISSLNNPTSRLMFLILDTIKLIT